MVTLVVLAILAGDGGGLNDRGYGFFGGLLNADLKLEDDLDICWGSPTCRYWMNYNSSSTRFEFWSDDVDGAGADGLLLSCDNGGDDCVFTGIFTATGGLAINADNAKLTLGAGGASDFEAYHDGTNVQVDGSGDFVFNISPVVGTFQTGPDNGLVPVMDHTVTSASGAGTLEGYVFRVDGNTLVKMHCDSNGAEGVEDCHTLETYAPVRIPGSTKSLSTNGNFDCDAATVRVVGNGGAVTLGTAPSVNDGDFDGQLCEIEGTDNTNMVTINHATNTCLAGGVNFTLGNADVLGLKWVAAASCWAERFRQNNTVP